MLRSIAWLVWFGLLALVGCQATRTPADSAPGTWLERIQGDWVGKVWGGDFWVTYRSYTPGSMRSVGNLVVDERVTFFEFENFAETKAGAVAVWTVQPYPMGRPEAVFTQVPEASEPLCWAFDNPENDFPTRITYDVREAGRLRVRLTDPHHGSDQVEDMLFERAP